MANFVIFYLKKKNKDNKFLKKYSFVIIIILNFISLLISNISKEGIIISNIIILLVTLLLYGSLIYLYNRFIFNPNNNLDYQVSIDNKIYKVIDLNRDKAIVCLYNNKNNKVDCSNIRVINIEDHILNKYQS